MIDNKIILLTGNMKKHLFLAVKIIKKFKNIKLIIEEYPKSILSKYSLSKSKLIKEHFAKLSKSENEYYSKYLKKNRNLIKRNLLMKIKNKKINTNKNFLYIKNLNPELVICNAVSYLDKKYVYTFKNKIINLHAGLTPYFLGTGCNVWPFYLNNLEYVGITLHFVSENLDGGDIILQKRPKFTTNDDTHTIGYKNVLLSEKMIIYLIKHYIRYKVIKGVKSDNKKLIKYCIKKDFKPLVVKKIKENLRNDIVRIYINNQKKIDIVSHLVK